ncbi:MAG: hypothetical protein IPI31_03180 [Bacteroidetes bacterium]|nr:hypothetical protein [Bacteroidota bacterium]
MINNAMQWMQLKAYVGSGFSGTENPNFGSQDFANLLEQDVLPDNILCLTYTEAGTSCHAQRGCYSLLVPDAHRVNIYTFHAFCNDVIRANLDYFGKRIGTHLGTRKCKFD